MKLSMGTDGTLPDTIACHLSLKLPSPPQKKEKSAEKNRQRK
ncbi:MAG: hypothetical protein WC489_03360 [Patescibacteria group bacterium]